MLIGAPRLTPIEHVFKELKWTDIRTFTIIIHKWLPVEDTHYPKLIMTVAK